MKIQYFSDLHLEFIDESDIYYNDGSRAADKFDLPMVGDVIVFAGDIHNGTKAINWFRKWAARVPNTPLLYVLGNHDYWGEQFRDLVEEWRELAKTIPNLHFLEKDTFEYQGVTFLGTTMWTDMDNSDHPMARISIAQRMNDYYHIRLGRGKLTITDVLNEHWASRLWLRAALDKAVGKKVVITHHLPSRKLVSKDWFNSDLTPAYYATCDALLPDVDLWIHGHQHASVDVKIGDCRVVSNPLGYFGIDENKTFKLEAIAEIDAKT